MSDKVPTEFDIQRIMQFLPHRYPFLLIDRVLTCSAGEMLSALKNVSFNEPYFQGHFPGQPIMPGVLVIEALAQATGLLSFCSMEPDNRNKLYMLVGIDKARFRGQVVPGDQLILTVNLKRTMRGIWMYEGKATVNDSVVAEAELMCSAQEKQQ
jgi:3-hydroxyacyl-[acyl-carrier-protein] dehydratase